MTAPRRAARTLRSYLLLPRPKDSVKWWITPAAFGVGVLSTGGASAHTLARAAVVWLALELLLYQARYQWNDIRGFDADQAHPDAATRGRLPGPAGRGRVHKRASGAVAVLRLALALTVALVLPGLHLVGPVVALAVGVFAIAVLYEALRTRATGRTGEVPPPLTPSLVALWVMVGAGYALRGLTGLALAVPLGRHPALAIVAGLTMWSLGVVFVTARWAVEALPFARLSGDLLAWGAERQHAREHLLGLVRWIPQRVPAEVARRGISTWAPVRRSWRLPAPWNVAGLVGLAAAACAGPLLADVGGASITSFRGVAVAVVPAVLAVFLQWAFRRQTRDSLSSSPFRRRVVGAARAFTREPARPARDAAVAS